MRRCPFDPGRTWFCTLVTRHRRALFADADNVHRLREALRQVKARQPFRMPVAVVLPDRLHCIWLLPPGDEDPVGRWRLVKRRLGMALGERRLWSESGCVRPVRDEAELAALVEWIHTAPVRAGLVADPRRWRWSSFRGKTGT